MTATNHALTGVAIGLISGRPLLAIPIALLSHYICDAIPHYRYATPQKLPDAELLKRKGFRNYLIGEAFVCFLIVLLLAITQPAHWMLAAICAFVAAAPDLASVSRYIPASRGQAMKAPGLYQRFAGGIQWFERPSGAVVEIAWFVGLVAFILPAVWH